MPVIDRLYAFVADEGNRDEGLAAFKDPDGEGWIPMVGADMERVEGLRPIAQMIATATRRKVTLKIFSKVDTIEEFEP